MNDDVVADRQVVTKRPFDEVPALEILAHGFEDQRREHATKTMTEKRIEAEWRTIEHLPQPDKRLALGVEFRIDVGIVFGLGRDVARIDSMLCSARG